MDEVYAKLNRTGFQSNKINNTLKRGLNYKLPQNPTVHTIPFQPQQPLSIQTTTLPQSGRVLVGPLLYVTLYPQTASLPQQPSDVQTASLPLSREALVRPSPYTTSPQRLSDVQTASLSLSERAPTASLPLSKRAPVGPSLYTTSPQQPSNIQTASLPLSRRAPVGPSPYTTPSTPKASFVAQPTEPLPNQKVNRHFSHSQLKYAGTDTVRQPTKEVTEAVIKGTTTIKYKAYAVSKTHKVILERTL